MLTLQSVIKKYLKKRNWHANPPGDIAKSISIEAAELLEHFQWHNPDRIAFKKDTEKYKAVQEEVADIFIYLAGMAITCEFDLEKAVYKKLEKVEKKYPVKAIINAGGQGEYLKIKEAYRKARKNK